MDIVFRGGSPLAEREHVHTFVHLLASDRAFTGHNIYTIAEYGHTTFDLIWDFDEEIQPLEPGLLVLQFGVDDMFRPVYRSEFKENLVQAIRRARRRFHPDIILCTTHLFGTAYENDAAGIYNRTTREVAADLQCEYIPLHLLWLNHIHENGIPVDDLLEADSRHPSQAGHMVTADAVRNKILKMINTAASYSL